MPAATFKANEELPQSYSECDSWSLPYSQSAGDKADSLENTVVEAIKTAHENLVKREKDVATLEGNIIQTQKANADSQLEQLKGDLLSEATKIVVGQLGSGVLDELANLDADELLARAGEVQARKKRQAAGCGRGPMDCASQESNVVRSITGKCNNPRNSTWGAAVTPVRRLLGKPSYADGFNAIRTRGVKGTPLPSTREVSNKLHQEGAKPAFEYSRNHFYMQFGQWVAHDIIFMPSSVGPNGKDLDCTSCSSPNVSENCAPIPVPADDSYFKSYNNGTGRCIRLTRALNAQKGLGVRTQINQNTHFLDLSAVYGSEECEGASVRSFANGELKTYIHNGDILPPQKKNANPYYCFTTGDFRNSLHPGLVPLHATYIKEHNRLAAQFKKCNPDWNDERIFQNRNTRTANTVNVANIAEMPNMRNNNALNPGYHCLRTEFGQSPTKVRSSRSPRAPTLEVRTFLCSHGAGQFWLVKDPNRASAIVEQFDAIGLKEARRVNIAQYQHHVYDGYLPGILGDKLMTDFRLKPLRSGFVTDYSPSVNAALSAEFAAAAFRFGHGQARKDFPRVTNRNTTAGASVDLGSNIFYVDSHYAPNQGGMASFIEGMMQHAVMKADNEFSFPIRNQLFEIRGRPASGVDLVAVNIMRGRDVGLFPYNDYRTLVGLRKANSFDDLRNEMDAVNVEALKRVYADVNDIDLYSGIMLERPLTGAQIGPTGGYIIAEQFAALKRGDRFYYENQVRGTRGLKPEELDAIRRTHLAKVICMNTAGMENVPVDVFHLQSERVPCSSLPEVDIRFFTGSPSSPPRETNDQPPPPPPPPRR
ncbi:animal hem peroxidase [Ancylostoma duodenale]|uniref:Animal hem peroxidase n=1 Tax=Ancylostoma duodenale TaxID=51022 RepID=A0A0C2D631_9BILA|nr:animal hem peroxidase [Ancylostoma duodenale]